MTKTSVIVLFGFCILTLNAFATNEESNDTLAAAVNAADNGQMTVVLTPNDIKKPGDEQEANAQISQIVEKDTTSPNDNGNHDNSTSQAVPLSAVPEINNSQATLPLVVRRTQVIGTPDQPTIDGGLMSAPDLVQTKEAGTNEAMTKVLLFINDQMMVAQDFMSRFDINYYNELMYAWRAKVMLQAKTFLNRIVMLQLKATEKPHRPKKRVHHGKA